MSTTSIFDSMREFLFGRQITPLERLHEQSKLLGRYKNRLNFDFRRATKNANRIDQEITSLVVKAAREKIPFSSYETQLETLILNAEQERASAKMYAKMERDLGAALQNIRVQEGLIQKQHAEVSAMHAINQFSAKIPGRVVRSVLKAYEVNMEERNLLEGMIDDSMSEVTNSVLDDDMATGDDAREASKKRVQEQLDMLRDDTSIAQTGVAESDLTVKSPSSTKSRTKPMPTNQAEKNPTSSGSSVMMKRKHATTQQQLTHPSNDTTNASHPLLASDDGESSSS